MNFRNGSTTPLFVVVADIVAYVLNKYRRKNVVVKTVVPKYASVKRPSFVFFFFVLFVALLM